MGQSAYRPDPVVAPSVRRQQQESSAAPARVRWRKRSSGESLNSWSEPSTILAPPYVSSGPRVSCAHFTHETRLDRLLYIFSVMPTLLPTSPTRTYPTSLTSLVPIYQSTSQGARMTNGRCCSYCSSRCLNSVATAPDPLRVVRSIAARAAVIASSYRPASA